MTKLNRFVVQMVAGGYVSLGDFYGNPVVTFVPNIADAHWLEYKAGDDFFKKHKTFVQETL